ncbi:expressed unknown protein [Ectocarpus siliculosus]|uniref:Uncharacterized protein n=1 Tax=Ectocarpus siliculosus TaxID=2880 RepID=D7G1N1_ECTSI|nr:expressed unknown protein [Ectocarpus siliculosus]|eukprot:CBJ33276.1 expressed unknown protein [Ectocarpus siliculosus]
MRRAGVPGAAGCFSKAKPTSSVGRPGSEYPSVPPAAVSKQGRSSHAPSETSRKSGRAAASTTAAAAVPAKWVWGQGQEEEEEEEEEEVEEAQQHQQTLSPVAHDLGGDAASKPAQPANIDVLRTKMFADSSSSSFESSCSTEAMTESTTSSPKDANWDAPFLSRLSDMSMMFPEPPTRPPAETMPSSSSRALTISGLGKNITSSLPSVQLLMPLRWRKRFRATESNKRCRKSTSRWIARSKATSSMSEKSFLARALSMNDNGAHRGKEAAAAAAGAKPMPSSCAVESTAATTPPRRRGVSKVAGETPSQLSKLSEVNERQEEERQEEEEARPAFDPPSALPTPVPHPAEKSPPPAPLHTAPRPPAPQKQRYNVAALLAARHSSRLRRRDCFASSPSAAGTEGTCFASSPSLSPPYMTVKNRLASSSSSIFEEDGDDNKKTLFLNPYSRSPLPPAAVAPRTAAAPAAKATAAQKNKPDATTGAAVDGARRRAAVAALQVEANRQYGDRRRRMKDGESGIWLPSPGIWSSARRPTPLNADLFSAW